MTHLYDIGVPIISGVGSTRMAPPTVVAGPVDARWAVELKAHDGFLRVSGTREYAISCIISFNPSNKRRVHNYIDRSISAATFPKDDTET